MTNSNNLSISRRTQYNQILKSIADYYSSETKLLVAHLYEQGYSLQKVADILGVSRQAIDNRFPKEGGKS